MDDAPPLGPKPPAFGFGPIFWFAYGIGKSRLGRIFVGWLFAHLSGLLPVRRLRETQTLMAFRHPGPSHAFHVLLVPKKALASLGDLTSADAAFLADLFSTVQQLVNEYELPAYRLIVNGGAYQDFPQLHFHLISDDLQPRAPLSSSPSDCTDRGLASSPKWHVD